MFCKTSKTNGENIFCNMRQKYNTLYQIVNLSVIFCTEFKQPLEYGIHRAFDINFSHFPV